MWGPYQLECESIQKKLNSDGNITRLWHGTRGNDPKAIVLGEDGLNIVHANNGMWGTGIYTALNANYSCPNYSYPVPGLKATYDILLCEVVLGDCLVQSATSGQKEPPMNSKTNKRYDSVTDGNIHVVYKNIKTYPRFLVRY